ncbi:PAS domain-containing protein [Hymenobacter rubripertinctus]|nr:PAS domain-containing protein [Hymenobacter rubripertinctus]
MPNAVPSAHLPGAPASPSVGAATGADLVNLSAEPKAHAVIEQQQQLRARLRDAPAAMASLVGPDHLVGVANDLFRQLFGGRPLAGLALRTALPELADQPFFALLDEAYRTGVTCYGHEAVAYAEPAGHHGPLYFTFMAQATRDAAGTVEGLLLFAYNVSAHVLARYPEAAGTPPPTAADHELALVNEELATTNEELLVSNEELVTTVAQLSTANAQLQDSNAEMQAQAQELRRAHKALRHLNQELEARVFERTQALRHARAESEATAQKLLRVTESLPSTSFTIDQSGQLLYMSPQWYAYTGLEPGADVTAAWPQLMHPADLPAIARELGTALAGGGPWRYEFRLRGADGQYRWFASQGLPEPLAHAEAADRPRQWFGSNLDIDDLKQAQQQLEEKDELLTSILSSLPASVVTFEGEDLRFGFFNDAFQRQAQGRAVPGRPAEEAFPEAEAQGFLTLLRQVLRTGEPYRAQEVPAQTRDPRTGQQQEMYLDLTYLPLRHGQQPPHAVLGFTLDVTDRVRARQQAEAAQGQALAAAEQVAAQREEFYQVFEQTPACIALLREPGHRFEYVNPAYQQLFPGRQLVGRTVAEALPEAVEHGFLDLLDGVFQTGETYFGQQMLLPVTRADGQPPQDVYFDFTYQALREAGHIVGISIFATDVTERVLARRQREAQQQQLAELFEQAPVAITVLRGPQYVIEVANPLVAQLWGRTPEQVRGKPLYEALPEVRDQGFKELLDQVVASGEAFTAQEVPAQLPRAGQLATVYLNFVYQPLRDVQGRIDSVAAVATDVTAQVLARQQLAQANTELTATNEQLNRTNTDLDNFVYTASHDLKQPITNLEGLLTALREELDLPSAQADIDPLLDLMQGAVERFQRTIAQLTDIAKLQAAHDDQPPTEVDLAALVADVCLDLRPQFRATGAGLTVEVTECPTLAFAEKNLRSIVFNLLSNALKYQHPDRVPRLGLRCYLGEAFAVLEVQDNGLGLDPDQQKKLFGLFRRLHVHVEGSGIGLYMVKKIIENAGGRIEVDSQPEIGSTFRLYFPRSR